MLATEHNVLKSAGLSLDISGTFVPGGGALLTTIVGKVTTNSWLKCGYGCAHNPLS